jgi:chromate transporter
MNREAAEVPFRSAIGVWARIALMSFGGPAGQIAIMHSELVEKRKWIDEPQFLHALNFCMLLPGPEAQQLATYIGWLKHGTKGGAAAGGLFILPGVVAIMGLSLVYAAWGQTPLIIGLFFGLKAAVLAIVIDAVIRIGRRALHSPAKQVIAAAAFVAIFFLAVPFPLIVLTAALLGFFAFAGPPVDGGRADRLPERQRSLWVPVAFLVLWLAPVVALLTIFGRGNVFTEIALFFSRMAVVTFGGAYAVLAYVAQQAVEHYHWLTAREMLDGLGMAETTPGPLLMVTQFVGFLAAARNASGLPPTLAGVVGGLLTTWVTFMPCFLWIFLGAPYVERLRRNRALAGALSAVTAAVVGVILNLGIWFALHFLFRDVTRIRSGPLDFDAPILPTVDLPALLLALAAAVAILRFRLNAMAVLALCGVAGLALRYGPDTLGALSKL